MRILKNSNGYAMYITILLIFLVTIIGISLLTLSVNAKKTTTNEQRDQSTFYFAEAGINLEKAKITDVVTIIDGKIKDFFNSLDYEEQVAILDSYGDFKNYYYSEFNRLYCNEYNTIFNPTDTIEKCTTNYYEGQYFLSEQAGQHPISDTKVRLDCSSSCKFEISATGYFEEIETFSPKHTRSASQVLTLDINAKLELKDDDDTGSGNDGGSGGGSGNNGGGSWASSGNYATITNKNITLSGGATLNGAALSIGGIVSLDGGAKINGPIAVSDPSKLVYPDTMEGVGDKYTDLPSDIPTENPLNQFLPEFPDDKMNLGNSIPLQSNLEIRNGTNSKLIIKDGGFYADNWLAKDYKLELTNDTNFTTFKIDENNTITIDVGDKEINLYVDDLNIAQGHIKIVGTGKLNIYAKNITKIKGSINSGGDPGTLNMYYNGTEPLSFANETKLYGSFYTKNSDLTLTGGAGFYGNLYSGGSKIVISGGVPSQGQMIVAPNAQLKLLEGGNIKGTVIADSIIASGGTSITFGEPVLPIPNTNQNGKKKYKITDDLSNDDSNSGILIDILIEGSLLED